MQSHLKTFVCNYTGDHSPDWQKPWQKIHYMETYRQKYDSIETFSSAPRHLYRVPYGIKPETTMQLSNAKYISIQAGFTRYKMHAENRSGFQGEKRARFFFFFNAVFVRLCIKNHTNYALNKIHV